MSITKIQSFRDLFAWQEAHRLVLDIYTRTKDFPKEEMYGLVNQMRRCAVSVSSNIAEGFSRQSYLEKAHFYSMSQGSITELQNQLIIANDVHYISDELFKVTYEQSVKVHKLLNGLIKKSKAIHNS